MLDMKNDEKELKLAFSSGYESAKKGINKCANSFRNLPEPTLEIEWERGYDKYKESTS
jgi:hypothetical protein